MTPSRGDGPLRVVVAETDTARRDQLRVAVEADGGLVVVGAAAGADALAELVLATRPDAIVLDADLPGRSSPRAIAHIMAHLPTPILVLTATGFGCSDAGDALVMGAVQTMQRPATWAPAPAAELRHHLRQISKVAVVRHPRGSRTPSAVVTAAPVAAAPLVAVAASTGGPSALAAVLAELRGLAAPVLIVQHLQPDFTRGMVEWMARISALPVHAAEHGATPLPGHVYIAPGEVHLRLDAQRRLALHETPLTMHRPSADELFTSVAEHVGPSAVGVLLTGMGEDGARGLLAIRRAGGRTFGQDEASCAVYGMPRAAARLGACESMLPLSQVAGTIKRTVAGLGHGR